MTLTEAFEIIMDLAVDNALQLDEAGEESLEKEYKRQQEAFSLANKIYSELGE